VVTEAISIERLSKLYATRDGGGAALEPISFSIKVAAEARAYKR
jgi:hypothetical protein